MLQPACAGCYRPTKGMGESEKRASGCAKTQEPLVMIVRMGPAAEGVGRNPHSFERMRRWGPGMGLPSQAAWGRRLLSGR